MNMYYINYYTELRKLDVINVTFRQTSYILLRYIV